MAAKKKSKKARGRRLSPAMISDLKKVMQKHNFVGKTLMWKPMDAGSFAAAGADGCPPGESLHTISHQDPNGNWITETVCM